GAQHLQATKTTLSSYTTLFRSLDQVGDALLAPARAVQQFGHLGGHVVVAGRQRQLQPAGVELDQVVPGGEPDRAAEHLGIALPRSEEHTSELQSRENLVCRILL